MLHAELGHGITSRRSSLRQSNVNWISHPSSEEKSCGPLGLGKFM
jgi:hypothetical protein